MASVYTQLKKGSSGNEVNALQTELSKKGYALQNTGLYDDATEAAVRKYQQDNNLTVDGIAGDITLGSLYGTNNNTATGGYKPSGQLMEAQKYAQAVQMQKPGEYQSAYTPQLQAQFDAIMNRQPFQYDIGSDALFQQMSDMYSQQARRGMQDTMGQATALTGGYGNSYAQGVGQAAYGQQMQQLAALAAGQEDHELRPGAADHHRSGGLHPDCSSRDGALSPGADGHGIYRHALRCDHQGRADEGDDAEQPGCVGWRDGDGLCASFARSGRRIRSGIL